MSPAAFATYIRFRTNTNATTFPDAAILALANPIKDDMAKEVTKVNEDYFGMELVRNLDANKRTYSFPTDILNQIKYTQARLNGVDWSELEEFDVTSYKRPTNETSILAAYAGRKAAFDIFGGQMTIYSDSAIIDVEGGLKLWAIIYPADLTSLAGDTDMSVAPSATSFGMPRQLHYVWATRVIVEYKGSKEKPIPLTEKEANVDKDMMLAINAMKSGNLNRTTTATTPYNDGQDY